jgi:hypothetical protein
MRLLVIQSKTRNSTESNYTQLLFHTHTRTLTHSQTQTQHTHVLSLSHTHTLTHSLSLTLSHTLSHTHTLTHSHTHTLTHTHTHLAWSSLLCDTRHCSKCPSLSFLLLRCHSISVTPSLSFSASCAPREKDAKSSTPSSARPQAVSSLLTPLAVMVMVVMSE